MVTIKTVTIYGKDSGMNTDHGGNIYDYEKIIYDFSVNTNPFGAPKGCTSALEHSMSMINTYPDITSSRLREEIATKENVSVDNVVMGNGAAELIYGVCNALRPSKGLVFAPTFSEYETALAASGSQVVRMSLRESADYHIAREEMSALFSWIRETSGRRMIFLCNPNNPTGVLTEKQQILRLADLCEKEDVYLVVDESFLPFLEDEEDYTVKNEIGIYSHIIVIRAFTKFYGMPGLRLGYAITSSKLMLQRLAKVLPPWNTSVFAQIAGVAALQDLAYEKKTKQMISAEQNYMVREIVTNGLAKKIFPPGANFILFEADEDLKDRLLEEGILIRDCSNFPTLKKGYYRVAIKDHNANAFLINAMKKCKLG